MKMILKVIDAPFALVLALLTALCWFLFDPLAPSFGRLPQSLSRSSGSDLFFTPTPLGGFVFMFLAFLLSPYGLQGGGCLADRSAGRRKIYSMPFSCKLIEPRATLA